MPKYKNTLKFRHVNVCHYLIFFFSNLLAVVDALRTTSADFDKYRLGIVQDLLTSP